MSWNRPELLVDIAWDSGPFDTSPTYTRIPTADILTWSYFRGQREEVSGRSPGTFAMELNANSRAYDNTYQSNRDVNKQCRVQSAYDSVTYPLWKGFVRNIEQNPPYAQYRVANINCTDGWKFFRNIDTKTYTEELTGARLNNIADDADFPSGAFWRDIDSGVSTLQEVEYVDAFFDEMVEHAYQTEGIGRFFFDEQGRLTLHDREAVLTGAQSKYSNVVFGSGSPGQIGPDPATWRGTTPIASDTVNTRGKLRKYQDTFLEYIVQIHSTGTPDLFKYSIDGGSTFSTPQAITGTWQVVGDSVEINFGLTTGHAVTDEWHFFAGELPTGIPKRVRSDDFVRNKVVVSRVGGDEATKEDAASQAAYGLRIMRIGRIMDKSPNAATDAAAYWLDRRKDPHEKFERLQFSGDMHPQNYVQMFSRQLGDRITYRESYPVGSRLEFDRLINGIIVTGDRDGTWKCEWMLTEPEQTAYWILNESQLDVNAYFGY